MRETILVAIPTKQKRCRRCIPNRCFQDVKCRDASNQQTWRYRDALWCYHLVLIHGGWTDL